MLFVFLILRFLEKEKKNQMCISISRANSGTTVVYVVHLVVHNESISFIVEQILIH